MPAGLGALGILISTVPKGCVASSVKAAVALTGVKAFLTALLVTSVTELLSASAFRLFAKLLIFSTTWNVSMIALDALSVRGALP